MARGKKLLYYRLFQIAGLVCYYFPFVTLGTFGSEEEETATGLESMTAIFFRMDLERDPVNWYLFWSFIFGIAAVVFLYQARKDHRKALYAGYSACGGCALLFLFRTTFLSYYGMSRNALSLLGIYLKFRFGWWIALLGFLAAGVGAITIYRNPEG